MAVAEPEDKKLLKEKVLEDCSAYYPTLDNFLGFCSYVEDARPIYKRDEIEYYLPKPPYYAARMIFMMRDERIVYLSENAGVKIRKYIDSFRKGRRKKLENKLLNAKSPALLCKIILDLIGELPLAIFTTLDDRSKFASNPPFEDMFPVQGRMSKWMKRRDYDRLDWDFEKITYGVD